MSIGRVPGVTGIQPSIVDAKGDLIVATAADSVDRLAVGANNTVLTADSATATGLKWATPAGSNFTLLNSGGTSLSGSQTVTISGISGADKILVYVVGASGGSSGGDYYHIRINTDSGSNYYQAGFAIWRGNDWNNQVITPITYWYTNPATRIWLGRASVSAASIVDASILIQGCNSSGVKVFDSQGTGNDAAGGQVAVANGGYWNNSATVTSISVVAENINFDAGTVFVFTSA